MGQGLRGVAKDVAIVGGGILVVWLGLQAAFGTQNPFYVVSSGSMIPALQVHDVLVVSGNEPFAEVAVGDIIVFNRPSGDDRVIVHRVAFIIDDDPLAVRTKGDANPASIPGTDFPITAEEYIGQVAYVIPYVGYVTRVLMPPVNYIIIAAIVGLMVAKQLSRRKAGGAGPPPPGGGPGGAPEAGPGGAEGGAGPEAASPPLSERPA